MTAPTPHSAGKLLQPAHLAGWRARFAPGPSAVAVVAGTFDILQPGNLCALRLAHEQTGCVVAVVEPDGTARGRLPDGRPWQPAAERAEFLACLRYVSAVAAPSPDRVAECMEFLRPYTLFHCQAQSPDTLSEPVRACAGRFRELPALRGCFTGDIIASIRTAGTPIRLPDAFPTAPAGSAPARPGRQPSTVTVNGCFDVLHIGHLRFLAEARAMGDELVVLINDDESVRKYKGTGRPVFPARFRAEALLALEPVTRVVSFPEDNPLRAISEIKPGVHVKGGSYEPARTDRERELVESWGGHLAFCPMVEGRSSTRFLNLAMGGAGLTS